MRGAITHIWMSPDTRKKSRYGLRTLGGIAGIVALAMLLVVGGTVLGLSQGWPAEQVSLLLCLGGTALVVFLAVRVGRRSATDATIFFQMEGAGSLPWTPAGWSITGAMFWTTPPPWGRSSNS